MQGGFLSDPAGGARQRRVGVRELRDNLPTFLRQVRGGDSLLITSNNQVVAELRPPPAAERPHRQPGRLRGRIRLSADFDELPPDILASMEGGE